MCGDRDPRLSHSRFRTIRDLVRMELRYQFDNLVQCFALLSRIPWCRRIVESSNRCRWCQKAADRHSIRHEVTHHSTKWRHNCESSMGGSCRRRTLGAAASIPSTRKSEAYSNLIAKVRACCACRCRSCPRAWVPSTKTQENASEPATPTRKSRNDV